MITRTIIIDTEEHAMEFDSMVQKLNYVKSVRKLDAKDVALGIGAPYSNEELTAFVAESADDYLDLDLEQSINHLKDQLRQK